MPSNTLWSNFRARDQVSGTVQRMNRSVTGFSRNAQASFRGIGSSISRIRGLITGAAVALTTGVAARAVTEFAEAGDEIAKTSRRLGIGVEAFQELRFAADRSGVSAETFTSAMEKLNKNVGDLRAGSGTLTTLLGRTDAAFAETLRGAESNEEAFTLLVDKIASIENPMDRAALAQAAFGRAGQDLIVMAENGSAGIEQLREEARRYGDIISTDAATSSEEFVDAMTNLKASVNGVKNNALVPLLSTIGEYIQKAADWASANRDLINEKITGFFSKLQEIGQTIAKYWENGLIPAILAGAAAFKVLTVIITGAQGLIAAIQMVKAAMAAGNILSMINPIGLIVAAIAAIVAITVLVAKNWDKVKAFLLKIWDGIKIAGVAVWEGIKAGFIVAINFVRAYFATVADFILSIFGNVVKTVLGVVSGIGKALGLEMNGVESTIDRISQAQAAVRDQSLIGGSSLLSANQGVQESRSTSESRSTVDVNFNNAPSGTTIRQRGQAQGIRLNTGYGGVM